MGQDYPLIQHVARYLAGRPGASGDWPMHLDDAASLLALIQQPDPAMVEAGDARVWIAMIDAALRERWTLAEALEAPAAPPPPSGHDEEGEVQVAPEHMRRDDAAWVGITEKKPA